MRISSVVACALVSAIMLVPPTRVRAQDATPVDRRWLDTTATSVERERMSTMIGLAPPEFTPGVRFVQDPMTLDALRGKVVVVQFWSRGDRRGTLRIEQLATMQKALGDDLVVVGVHQAQLAEGVDQFLERRSPGVPVAIDTDGQYAQALGARSNLANLIIDRAGNTRYVLLNPNGIENAAKALLAESAPPSDADAPVRTPLAPPTTRLPSKERDQGGFWDERIPDDRFPAPTGDVGDANDLRGKRGPDIVVDEWLTKVPDATNKVVIVDFWATWCGPCVAAIPHMNRIQQQFSQDVVVIGISNEPPDKIKGWLPGKGIKYSIGTDPQVRMGQLVRNNYIPHALIYSPDGVIRWQGNPGGLKEEDVRAIVEASRKR